MRMPCVRLVILCACVWACTLSPAANAAETDSAIHIGVARLDITPEYPVRLSGYSSRRENASDVAQRIWAKALAIRGGRDLPPVLLLTVENCGVPQTLVDAVCQQLESDGIQRQQVVVSSSHSHTAPWLIGFAPFLAREPVPADHQQSRERYTRELIPQLVRVARDALADLRPAHLFRGQGTVSFAANRRVLRDGSWVGFGVQPDGPVDHRLPLLVAKDDDGRPRAIWANYACHCTTLGGDFNQVAGDWSGCAQEQIEKDFPTAIALISIGCGADANPEPRGTAQLARQHGLALAEEVRRVLGTELSPLQTAPVARRVSIELPLGPLPEQADWQKALAGGGSDAQRARHFLQSIERGEALPTTVPYPIACWTFGEDLAMVFLAGEVVVDYALALDRRLDSDRLWLTAYANDVPCYIASKRILREGGYEADQSMVYYGQPTRLAEAAEDRILETVVGLLPGFCR